MKKTLFFILALACVTVAQVNTGDSLHSGDATPQEMQYVVDRQVLVAEAKVSPWDAMSAPIHALALSMVERDLEYAVENPDFFWSSLYYMVGMYQVVDFRVEDAGDFLLVPEEMLQDCAFALFGERAVFPEVPEEMLAFISHEPENYVYRLAKGDAAWVECVKTEVIEQEGGTVLVTGDLVAVAEEGVISSFVVELQESDSVYGYHLVGMDLVPVSG